MNRFKALSAAILIAITTACSDSTEDLTKDVRASMETKFKDKGIVIKSLIVTKKGGNEYIGVLETTEPNGAFTYQVDIISDGKNFTYQIKQ